MALSVVVLVLATVFFLVRSRTGEIPYRGGVVRIPLRAGAFRVMVAEGRARYVMPGPADIKPMLEERAEGLGWRFLDQMGAMYSILSNRGDGLRVVMVTEAVMSQFVEVNCHVEPTPFTGSATPPPP